MKTLNARRLKRYLARIAECRDPQAWSVALPVVLATQGLQPLSSTNKGLIEKFWVAVHWLGLQPHFDPSVGLHRGQFELPSTKGFRDKIIAIKHITDYWGETFWYDLRGLGVRLPLDPAKNLIETLHKVARDHQTLVKFAYNIRQQFLGGHYFIGGLTNVKNGRKWKAQVEAGSFELTRQTLVDFYDAASGPDESNIYSEASLSKKAAEIIVWVAKERKIERNIVLETGDESESEDEEQTEFDRGAPSEQEALLNLGTSAEESREPNILVEPTGIRMQEEAPTEGQSEENSQIEPGAVSADKDQQERTLRPSKRLRIDSPERSRNCQSPPLHSTPIQAPTPLTLRSSPPFSPQITQKDHGTILGELSLLPTAVQASNEGSNLAMVVSDELPTSEDSSMSRNPAIHENSIITDPSHLPEDVQHRMENVRHGPYRHAFMEVEKALSEEHADRVKLSVAKTKLQESTDAYNQVGKELQQLLGLKFPASVENLQRMIDPLKKRHEFLEGLRPHVKGLIEIHKKIDTQSSGANLYTGQAPDLKKLTADSAKVKEDINRLETHLANLKEVYEKLKADEVGVLQSEANMKLHAEHLYDFTTLMRCLSREEEVRVVLGKPADDSDWESLQSGMSGFSERSISRGSS